MLSCCNQLYQIVIKNQCWDLNGHQIQSILCKAFLVHPFSLWSIQSIYFDSYIHSQWISYWMANRCVATKYKCSKLFFILIKQHTLFAACYGSQWHYVSLKDPKVKQMKCKYIATIASAIQEINTYLSNQFKVCFRHKLW